MSTYLQTYHECSAWDVNKTTWLHTELDTQLYQYLLSSVPTTVAQRFTSCANSGRAALLYLQQHYRSCNKHLSWVKFYQLVNKLVRKKDESPVAFCERVCLEVRSARHNLVRTPYSDADFDGIITALILTQCELPPGHSCYETLMEHMTHARQEPECGAPTQLITSLAVRSAMDMSSTLPLPVDTATPLPAIPPPVAGSAGNAKASDSAGIAKTSSGGGGNSGNGRGNKRGSQWRDPRLANVPARECHQFYLNGACPKSNCPYNHNVHGPCVRCNLDTHSCCLCSARGDNHHNHRMETCPHLSLPSATPAVVAAPVAAPVPDAHAQLQALSSQMLTMQAQLQALLPNAALSVSAGVDEVLMQRLAANAQAANASFEVHPPVKSATCPVWHDSCSPLTLQNERTRFISLFPLRLPIALSAPAVPGIQYQATHAGVARYDSLSPTDGPLTYFCVSFYAPGFPVNLLSEVTVDAIPSSRTVRAAGALTVYVRDVPVMYFTLVGSRFVLRECSAQVPSHALSFAVTKQALAPVTAELMHQRTHYKGDFARVQHLWDGPRIQGATTYNDECGSCLQRGFNRPIARRKRTLFNKGLPSRHISLAPPPSSDSTSSLATSPSISVSSRVPIGTMVHADSMFWSHRGMRGEKYALILVDDESDFVTVVPLVSLKAVHEHVIEYCNKVKRQQGVNVTVLRSDNGAEFVNHSMQEYIRSEGIDHQVCAPYFHQGNGKAEIYVQLVKCLLAAFLHQSNVSHGWWSEAILHVVDILNMFPSHKWPHASRYERKEQGKRRPSTAYLRTFGVLGYGWQDKSIYGTSSFRAMYLGMGPHYRYFKLYDLASKRIRITPAFVTSEKHFLRSPAVLDALLQKWTQAAGMDVDAVVPSAPSPMVPSHHVNVGDVDERHYSASSQDDGGGSAGASDDVHGLDINANADGVDTAGADVDMDGLAVDARAHVAPQGDGVDDAHDDGVDDVGVGVDVDSLDIDVNAHHVEDVGADMHAVDALDEIASLEHELCPADVDDIAESIEQLPSVHPDGSESHLQPDGTLKWTVDRLGARSNKHGIDGYDVQWVGNVRSTWRPRSELLEDCPDLVHAREAYVSSRGRLHQPNPAYAPHLVRSRIQALALPVRCSRIEAAIKHSRMNSRRRARISVSWDKVRKAIAADDAHLQMVLDELAYIRDELSAVPDAVDFNDVLPLVLEHFPHLRDTVSAAPWSTHRERFTDPARALASDKGNYYKVAKYVELLAYLETRTFRFRSRTSLPSGTNIMKLKQVLTEKFLRDEFTRCKWRVCAKGFTQLDGVDFDSLACYAPTADYDSIRLILALCAKHGLRVESADFVSAYLQAKLDHDCYTEVLPGYLDYLRDHKGDSVRVRKLKLEALAEYNAAFAATGNDPSQVVTQVCRAVPGMRQSGFAFNQKLHKFLVSEGWSRLNQDLAVYTRVRDGKPQIIACFVDDILMAGVGDSFRAFKNTLKEKFKITFQPVVDQYCGVEIDHDAQKGTYTIHQRSYVKQLHVKFMRYLPLRHVPAATPFPAVWS